nr:DNA excision repair protein ERCC-6-like isoform X1 [Leptinotarsa decemlineata]
MTVFHQIDLNQLLISEQINVWGANQEVLEEQALKELEIFAEDNKTSICNEVEDGEIQELEDSSSNKIGDITLNIDKYIQQQEALKKRQEFKKSLDNSSEQINIKFDTRKKRKRKKLSESIKTNFNIVAEISDNTDFGSIEHNLKSSRTNKRSQVQESPANDISAEDITKNIVDEHFDSSRDDISGSEYFPSENEKDSDQEFELPLPRASKIPKSQARKRKRETEIINKVEDDGVWQCYKARLDVYYKKLEEELDLRRLHEDDDSREKSDFHLLKGGLKVPLNIWDRLYGYQQDSVKWLWKIHQKSTGALLGDEMGLGKTVQIIAFLQALEISRVLSCHGRFNGLGPSLVVCPATVIHQWVKHFHEWAPEFRVAVLHQSGSFQGNKADLIKDMHETKGIIITTYLGILKYKDNLLDHNWHYVILDEGHKIRNPTAKVTVAVKQIRTPHRIMLTGSPMQNNLTELWSLFDYTNPGMLGNLSTFQEHFANPILHGGFANSTPMQEATALSVATTLKHIITPYMLRRSKTEVQHHISLPNKSEQVLFCSLSKEQTDLYKNYLMSEHVNMILGRGTKNWFSDNHIRSNVLVAITKLRKICNHPDIFLNEEEPNDIEDSGLPEDERFGYYKKSGKMVVVSALLKIWKKQGHRVLLFTQSRSMILILEQFLHQNGYKYLKMDGSTSISKRQPLIDKFNQDSSYDVFLSTTRVGGLGVNLTGANRVIIFDPDWNPATDTQARERAWRIGQDKEVTIYRLLSAGTIEEKMYQRQVWKQLLSNKILIDPKTNKFFKSSDLHDLFSLQEQQGGNPETANIFHDSRVRIQDNIKKKNKKKKSGKSTIQEPENLFTEEKIQQMKNLAQQIAKSLSKQPSSFQLELEEERLKKLQEKEALKKLTPQELLQYNKKKAIEEKPAVNEIDGSEAKVSFSEALEYSKKTAELHHDLISHKKDPLEAKKTVDEIHKQITKAPVILLDEFTKDREKSPKREKKKRKNKCVTDISGTIDGEQVEGLVKTEVKKRKKEKKLTADSESQDDYVLGKLFQKTGVSGALKHESIVNGRQGGNLRIHSETKMRAEKSLEALRKSRVDNWRW